MKSIYFAIVTFFLLSTQVFAVDHVYLVGKVKSFNDKGIKVISGNTIWTIPHSMVRHQIKADDDIKIGMTRDELNKIPHELSAKK